MKTKSFLLTLSLSGLVFQSAFSNLYIDTVYAYSSYYTDDSSAVYLVASEHFPNTPCWLQSFSITDTLNVITADLCFRDGNITSICSRVDTFYLGTRKNENSTIRAIIGRATSSSCDTYLDRDTIILNYNIGYTGIRDVKAKVNFVVAPNPANNEVIITFCETTTKRYTVTIVDLVGKVVLKTEVREQKTEIGTAALPEGVYLVMVEANDGRRWVKKLVKE